MTPEYHTALIELLYQLADDNFILAYRGSEWLGLTPHIEEDVAFSSINQNAMGHAAIYYQMLEDLGEGKSDDLAHLRAPASFRNAVLLELKNGPGSYWDAPDYDWAFAVVRHFFFDVFKSIRLNALKKSSYPPLAAAAGKIVTEQAYHLMHWETWFVQLMMSTDEARRRMEKALSLCWADAGGLLSLGKWGAVMAEHGLTATEAEWRDQWRQAIGQSFSRVGYVPIGEPGMAHGDGRNGEHTADLGEALSILSEVYRSDPQATGW